MLIFYFQNCQLSFLSSVIYYDIHWLFRFYMSQADNAQLYKNIDLLTIETLVSGVYYILVQKMMLYEFCSLFYKTFFGLFKKMYGTVS